MKVRPASSADAAFLAEMLVDAVSWRPDAPRPATADLLAMVLPLRP